MTGWPQVSTEPNRRIRSRDIKRSISGSLSTMDSGDTP
jgi:hypothetical protein